jgi:hypothetical protein
LVVAAGVALMIVQSVQASGKRVDSFDALANALSKRYSVKATKIPLMWMVSVCARGATRGGVRGMRVVEFDHFGAVKDGAAFEDMVRSRLGDGWSQAVREQGANGEESLVYARAHGRLTELVVVDLDREELDLIRMEMDPSQLARWASQRKWTLTGGPSAQ